MTENKVYETESEKKLFEELSLIFNDKTSVERIIDLLETEDKRQKMINFLSNGNKSVYVVNWYIENLTKDKKKIPSIRRTIAYKICGYSFYVILCLVILSMFAISCLPWGNLLSVLLGVTLVGFAPIAIFPCFIILTIIGIITKNKYINNNFDIFADIGYTFIVALFIISIGILCNL